MKDWFESKTLIINAALSLVSLILLLTSLLASPEMARLGVDPEIVRYAGIVGLVAGVVNTWLRAQTTTVVRLPGQTVTYGRYKALQAEHDIRMVRMRGQLEKQGDLPQVKV